MIFFSLTPLYFHWKEITYPIVSCGDLKKAIAFFFIKIKKAM